MRAPESYIVRVYRRGFRSMAGVLEHPATGRQRPFMGIQELWDLLRTSCRAPKRPPKSASRSWPMS
jgi:hypothetical protein